MAEMENMMEFETGAEYSEDEVIAHPPVNFAKEKEEPEELVFEEIEFFESPDEALKDAFDGELPEEALDEGVPVIISFDEEYFDLDEDVDMTPEEELFDAILAQIGLDDEEDEIDEKLDDEEKDDDEDEDENEAADEMIVEEQPSGRRIPGTQEYIQEEAAPAPEMPKETDWVNDRDPAKFIDYLRKSMHHFDKQGIPGHDGKSHVGFQRAIEWLKRLDKEISEAIRRDVKNDVDANEVEKYRETINSYVSQLKEHLGKLKKISNKDDVGIIKAAEESEKQIKNAAYTDPIQVVMTPFERAISGVLINAVVKNGRPFEEVYDFLKEKYKLTDREELALLQIVMDFGYPLHIDRGRLGESKDDDDRPKRGLDFVKTYFS